MAINIGVQYSTAIDFLSIDLQPLYRQLAVLPPLFMRYHPLISRVSMNVSLKKTIVTILGIWDFRQ